MLSDGIDELLLPFIIVLVGIVASNNARFRHRLCRRALLHPILSPWQNLINYADESSFLTVEKARKNLSLLVRDLILASTP